ncbi:MAG: T9SS type A sorting domain-containing protein [Bacteroidales bacterium]|nr:T9SS type A sorting domain-containing protein [Bacteroidales bacterium]
MKKITLLLMLILGMQYLNAQTENLYYDISPNVSNVNHQEIMLYPWEILFNYSFPNLPLSYVAETDGDYFYVGAWNFTTVDTMIRKYDMQGNFIENFYIPGTENLRDMTYDGTYFYSGLSAWTGFMKMDFDNQVLIDTIPTTFRIRALAYDDDLNVFYGNCWSNAIKKFAPDGTLLDTMPLTGAYGSYYGFAYDNWSSGGPYLWGFSQDIPGHHNIVQMKLPACTETGFVFDAGTICYSVAGGLFTYPDYDSSRVVIGGVNQNKCLFGLELAPLAPPPVAFQVGGAVNTSTTILDAGTVDLYKIEFNTITEQYTTNIDLAGDYLFDEVFEGDYYVQARPPALSALAEEYAPTYLGGQVHWEDVSTSYFAANSYDNNIELVEMAALSGGIGSVSGKVFELTTDAEIPLEDAQVMLLNANDECIAVVYTNTDGEFSFGDIALETYGLLVEIPGKTMEPMSFTLTELEPGLSDINLYVTEGSIIVGIEEEFPSWIDHVSNIYPNPARSQTSLNIRLDEASRLHVRIFSLSGQQIQQELFELKKGQNLVNLDLQKLNSGVFYVTLEFNNEFTLTRKLLIIE